MRCVLALLFLISASAAAEAADLSRYAAIVEDPGAVACFDELVRLGGYGRRHDERAAFLVDRNGRLECVPWPSRNEFQAASWGSRWPEGVVAIAHTHPRQFPLPSAHDHLEARRLQMPVIVVTPGRLEIAD